MAEEQQIQLFDVVQYGGKKQRGHYKKKDKTEKAKDDFEKIKDLSLYAENAEICASLANYLPVLIFSAENSECAEYEYLNHWQIEYKAETYTYDGEICRGEKFKINEAELKGTEKLKIDKRLYLHKKLFELVKSGVNIHKAAEQLQEEIKRLNNGENYTMDRNQGGLSARNYSERACCQV